MTSAHITDYWLMAVFYLLLSLTLIMFVIMIVFECKKQNKPLFKIIAICVAIVFMTPLFFLVRFSCDYVSRIVSIYTNNTLSQSITLENVVHKTDTYRGHLDGYSAVFETDQGVIEFKNTFNQQEIERIIAFCGYDIIYEYFDFYDGKYSEDIMIINS